MVRPGYKQTEVGVIPEEWDVKPLIKIADRIMVGIASAATHAYRVKGVPMFRNQNIKVGHLDDSDLLFIAPEYEATFKNKRLRGGDLLTMRTGYPGVTAIVPAHYDSAQSFTTLITRPKQDEAESEYLCHFINSELGQRFFTQNQIGGAQKNVNVGTLRKMPVPLPKPPEQRAIAEALSDVDGLLGGLDRLIAKKRDLKQAAMQQLLTGQTRLPVFHGEWRVRPLGELITHCFSGATPRRNHPDFFQGDVRWITSGELNYNVITDTLEKITPEAVKRTNLAIVPAGTFLMAITGLEAEGTRGACGIVGAPSTTNQSCMAVFPTSELVTSYLFYYYVLRGKSLALQYCQGTKQQSYTARLVKQLPIEIPPTPAEQTAIAEVLTEMDKELAALEQRREKTRALKQAMMQELLTGITRLV